MNSSSFLVRTSSTQLLSCYKVSNGHLSVLPVGSFSARMFTPSYHITVRCFVFGRWRTWRSWRTGLLGVVKWRGVNVHLLGTSEWRGQLCLRRRTQDIRPNTTLSLHKWLAPSLPFENSIGQKLCTALQTCLASNLWNILCGLFSGWNHM